MGSSKKVKISVHNISGMDTSQGDRVGSSYLPLVILGTWDKETQALLFLEVERNGFD